MSDNSDLGDLGDLGDLDKLGGELGDLIRKYGMEVPMETRLMRLLAEQKGPFSAGFIEWLVTGKYPEPQVRFDIVRVRGDLLQF